MTLPQTVNEWLAYLESLDPYRMEFGLDRIIRVADVLKVRQFSCPVIMVAGTNGKGSCVNCLREIYQAAGFNVATYTSPHLVRFHERIQINGHAITDAELVRVFTRVRIAQLSLLEDTFISYFEFTTLAALAYFQSQKPDVVILEVGLGGRLDAVNVVEPDVSVITGIDLDHQDKLGDTRDLIATEKMGIARANKPLVCGDPHPPAVIAQLAEKRHSELTQQGRHFHFDWRADGWHWQGVSGQLKQLPKPAIKPENASTSLQVIALLQAQLPVALSSLHKGLSATHPPGRFQQIADKPAVIIDVAHNPQACTWLAEQVRQRAASKRVLAVCGMLSNKALAASFAPMVSVIDTWFLGECDTPRKATIAQMQAALQTASVKTCYTFTSIAAALASARREANEEDLILIFGSFYTVGAALQEMDATRRIANESTN